jgi:hypothetical protein
MIGTAARRRGKRIAMMVVGGLLLSIPAAPAAAANWKSGVFAGYGPSLDEQFATWRGSPIQTATDYMESSTWSELENPAWDIWAWRQAVGVRPVLTVPMWPGLSGSLADAAAGSYNGHFATMARNLIAGGLGSAILRIGWEFNAWWYPWSVRTASDASLYAQAWRQIVGAIKAVPGAHFSFDWSMTVNAGGIDPALAYPGDAYVNSIGMDVYDWNERAPNETPSQRWSDLVGNGYGLAWQANFAAAHHKPISFAEWALVYYTFYPAAGGGDDPMFVQNMFNWFAGHNTAFENYFDTQANGAYFAISGNALFPRATALYRTLYSSSIG